MIGRLAPALFLASASLTHVEGQSPTFSSRVEAVRLDVLVLQDGRPVAGLRSDDFEVFDNGVRQSVTIVSPEQLALSVILALDASASVAGERLNHLTDAGKAVLAALKKNDRAALLTITTSVSLDADLTSDTTKLEAALDSIDPDGDTALTDGAYVGISVADGSSGRGLLIIFSDGSDTASWLLESSVVEAARRSEVVVYAISAGARDRSFLRELANATGGRVYEVESTRNLRSLFLAALEEFRQRYLLSYTPTNVAKGGWHKVEVRVKGRRATVKTRPGYMAGN
jgi:Ca-activated chloride channel homolog